MKKYIIFTIGKLFAAGSIALFAQDATQQLDQAKSSYQSGDLENTRFALQQALIEIDEAMGQEILAMLPEELEGMAYVHDDDDVTGTNLGFAGLYVNRNYSEGESKSANVQLVTDSPFLAGINAILAMPTFVTAGDNNQKRVKIAGYKALLQRNESEEGSASYDIQIPFGQSLLTFHCNGFGDEALVLKMANQLPVEEIVKMAR